MANKEVIAEDCKKFLSLVNDAHLHSKAAAFDAVIAHIKNGDIPENGVRTLFRLLLSAALLRYQDRRSWKLARSFLKSVFEGSVPGHLSMAIKVFAEACTSVTSINLADGGYRGALLWIKVLRYAKTTELNAETLKAVVDSLGRCLYGYVELAGYSDKEYIRKLTSLLRDAPILRGQLVEAARIIDFDVTIPAVLNRLCLLSYLTSACRQLQDVEAIEKFKHVGIDAYVKAVLAGKSKPPVHVVNVCQLFICLINKNEFEEFLLPNIMKYLLRNPEIILEAVRILYSQLSTDLSPFALDLTKAVSAQLYSKEDSNRAEAASIVKSLVHQCSDKDAVESMLRHLFCVLNGSEGKLTTPQQRMGVISAIGQLANHVVCGSQSVSTLSLIAIDQFIKLMSDEVHEATLVLALNALTMWSVRLQADMPAKLTDYFKSFLKQHLSSPSVRFACLQCMNATYKGQFISEIESILPDLLAIFDRALKQSSHNALLWEGLGAAQVLMKLHALGHNFDAKLDPLWAAVFEKQLFASPKLLSSASDEEILALIAFIAKLLLEHSANATSENQNVYYDVLLYALTERPHAVRRAAKDVIKRLLTLLEAARISEELLKLIYARLTAAKKETDKMVAPISINSGVSTLEDTEKAAAQAKNSASKSKLFAEADLLITQVKDCEKEAENNIALKSLVVANHPIVVLHDRLIWLKLTRRLNVYQQGLIEEHMDEIWRLLCDFSSCSVEITKNCIGLLSKLHPTFVFHFVMDKVAETISEKDVLSISAQHVEIFLTPAGQLYDKSILATDSDNAAEKAANLKRESKLYSYKDQMADLAIRQELEKKKKAATDTRTAQTTEAQLTPKQKEALKQQLAKEAEIREQVRPVFEKVELAFSILLACCDRNGNRTAAAHFVSAISDLILSALQIPVCARFVASCWIELSVCAFPDKQDKLTGKSIAYTTVRALGCDAIIDRRWTDEALSAAFERCVALIESKISTDTAAGEETASEKRRFLAAPAFAFCLPLLKHVTVTSKEMKLVQRVVKVVSLQTEAFLGQNEADIAHYLEQLPILELVNLLFTVLETSASGSQEQQVAAGAMLQLSAALSKKSLSLQQLSSRVFSVVWRFITGVVHESPIVREYSLKGITELAAEIKKVFGSNPELKAELTERLWIARSDHSEVCQELAESLWPKLGLKLNASACTSIVENSTHASADVRQAASLATAAALKQFPAEVSASLERLLQLYKLKLAEIVEPVKDEFGRVIKEGQPDNFGPRIGLADTLKQLCPLLAGSDVPKFVAAIVPDALMDRNAEVRLAMLRAATEGVKEHGKEHINDLLPMFEKILDNCPATREYDVLRQSLVILMGTLAQHLSSDDTRVRPIVGKLIETLNTPSQKVQEAVANCLPPLVPAMKDQVPDLVNKLMHLLFEADQYGERRGAAYGIAGIVKGIGILSLKQLNIMPRLQEEIGNKKQPRRREGCLLAFEMLCQMLGRLFEPYIVHILPSLLQCFGDADQHVRVAAEECSKAVMQQLSAHGVKLVLPSLLAALEEDSWRTKSGSVELLGAMAFCAPKQLSSCLPSIVPKVIEVLADTHTRVQKSGEQALMHIGQVIKNPEIQVITNVLLDALLDPSHKTVSCLNTLLATRFVHYIDAPSLALIMPIVQRGLEDRSSETRRMAAQVVANMYSLTDQKDIEPYQANLLPGLKKALVDPAPEVRAVGAKAFGSMVRSLGPTGFDTFYPWLQQTLVTETNPVDRSGAAQGLSEAIAGVGPGKLEELLPGILKTASSTDCGPAVRDGHIMIFIYLPAVFGDQFLPFLPKIIPVLLHALADENEFVRDTSLRAGQRLINVYADTAIPLFLPSLERGLFDDNWRIRYSSVQLIGDLLFKISGVTGKMSTECGEDDSFGTEVSSKVIAEQLGADHRNRILAGLYMARCDVALLVRQASSHVWKVIVSNTPRTLKELLPTLFQLLLACLASSCYDKQQVAARCLGELVKKMGERILVDIVPVLERGLQSPDADQRQGVCIALSEIMSSTTREMVMMYAENLIPTIRTALSDTLTDVRQSAAKTFDVLHSVVGASVLDDVVAPLLIKLETAKAEDFENILDGLRCVTKVKSRVILPFIIPKLTATASVNTRVLAELASVCGDVLSKNLLKILPALLQSLCSNINGPKMEQEKENCLKVLLAVSDDYGINTVLDMVLSKTVDKDITDAAAMRKATTLLMSGFCQNTKLDLKPYFERILKGAIALFKDSDEQVLTDAAEALNCVGKCLETNEQLDHVSSVRSALRGLANELKPSLLLPGFCTGKGLQTVLMILREGILSGNGEMKESAALGLLEVIQLSSDQGLKPHVINVTGPMIRILGERYPPTVKTAILNTLALLLKKAGILIKPFLPQLQSTFLKALQDPSSRQVRLRAGIAMAALSTIHPKCEQLVTDAFNNAKSAEDPSIKETFLITTRCLVEQSGSRLGPECRSLLTSGLTGFLANADDTVRISGSAALGALIGEVLPLNEADPVVREHLFAQHIEWTHRHGAAIALQVALKRNAKKLAEISEDQIIKTLMSFVTGDRVPVCTAGLRASAFFIGYQLTNGVTVSQALVSCVARSINHASNDVKTLAAVVCGSLADRCESIDNTVLKLVVPSMVNGTKEKNSAVKYASEEALVGLLFIRKNTSVYSNYLNSVDEGARIALEEVYTKTLQKMAKQLQSAIEELDDTDQTN